MPAANTVAFGAVLAAAGAHQMYIHNEKMKGKKREAAADREARQQDAASRKFVDEMQQRAAESAEREQQQSQARGRGGSWIGDIQLEFANNSEKQLRALIDRLDRGPGASWTRSPAVAVALCAACCAGNRALAEKLLIEEVVKWAASSEAPALGLSCTRVSPRSAQAVAQWFDRLAAGVPGLSSETLSALFTLCAESREDDERHFVVVDLSGDSSGAVLTSLQQHMGLCVLPLKDSQSRPDADGRVYRHLQSKLGVGWVNKEFYCAATIKSVTAYKRRSAEISQQTKFKEYGPKSKYP
jgi:hypothetical protein